MFLNYVSKFVDIFESKYAHIYQGLLIFINVCSYLSRYALIYQAMLIFIKVCSYLSMFAHIHQCLLISINVCSYFQGMLILLPLNIPKQLLPVRL